MIDKEKIRQVIEHWNDDNLDGSDFERLKELGEFLLQGKLVEPMSKEEIENISLEIIVPKKEWESMSEAQQSYVKGRNQERFYWIQKLVGKVGVK